MVEYNQSLNFDRAFYAHDIAGSIAWARALCKTGILSGREFSTIEKGLKQVKKEWEDSTFVIVPGTDEDIHTANERRLSEIGRTSKYLHLHEDLTSTSWKGHWRQATHRYEAPKVHGSRVC